MEASFRGVGEAGLKTDLYGMCLLKDSEVLHVFRSYLSGSTSQFKHLIYTLTVGWSCATWSTLALICSTVTHPVVSQVNPHVHLFFFAPRGSAGKPVAHRKGKGNLPFKFFLYLTYDFRRVEGKFPPVGSGTMAETRINQELQGHTRSWTPSSVVRSGLVQCFLTALWRRSNVSSFRVYVAVYIWAHKFSIWPRTRLWVCHDFLDIYIFSWIRMNRIGFGFCTTPIQKSWKEWYMSGKALLGPRWSILTISVISGASRLNWHIQLHMIENRFRIEKQILLGRQIVHRAYKSKSRTDSHEPRHLLLQKTMPETSSRPQENSPSLSPPPSGSELPLSVDTDAEAAFARGSRFYRRGRTSKNVSPNGSRDKDPLNSHIRRRKWFSEPNVDEGNPQPFEVPASTGSNTVPLSPSFFSRISTNSIPKLSLPFSLEHATSPRRESSADNKAENNWSSESSTDDYPLHE